MNIHFLHFVLRPGSPVHAIDVVSSIRSICQSYSNYTLTYLMIGQRVSACLGACHSCQCPTRFSQTIKCAYNSKVHHFCNFTLILANACFVVTFLQKKGLYKYLVQDFSTLTSSRPRFSFHGCFSASLPGLCPRDSDSPCVLHINLGYRNIAHRCTRQHLFQPCYQQPGESRDSYIQHSNTSHCRVLNLPIVKSLKVVMMCIIIHGMVAFCPKTV